MRTFVKAEVIDIVDEAGMPALGSRLSGIVAGNAGGRTQIRSAGSTVTIAAVADLKVGARVTLTLLRNGDGLVARLQLAPPSPPTMVSNAAAEPPRAQSPEVGVKIAPLSALPAIQAPQRASIAWSIEAITPTVNPTSAPPTEQASPKPVAGAGTGISVTGASTDGTGRVSAAVCQPGSAPTESSQVAQEPPAMPRSNGFQAARGPSRSPSGLDAPAPVNTPSVAFIASKARENANQLRSPPSVEPSALLDLLTSSPAEVQTYQLKGARTPDSPAKPTSLDVEHLGRSLAHLADSQPSVAHLLLTSALPQPDKNLGRVLFRFVAALGNSDPSIWLGQSLNTQVSSASPTLAEQLGAMVADRAHPAPTAHAGWREAELPLLTPTGILPMRVMVEEKPDDQDAEQPESRAAPPKRLILECTLSQFERIQLDMLVRKPKRCDVIVRSTIPLPRDVEALITQTFLGVGDETGLSGSISFQSAPAGFSGPSPSSRVGAGFHLSA
jgi:hypothetical protein